MEQEYIFEILSLSPVEEEKEGSRFLRMVRSPVRSCNAEPADLSSPDSISSYFKHVPFVAPEKVVRPKGDTTMFTSAGVQRIETIIREGLPVERESYLVCQPVIRSQFMDRIREGTSTSFVNISVETMRARPSDFSDLCRCFIALIEGQGVSSEELLFTLEKDSVRWGKNQFDSLSLTFYANGVELGECVYLYDYPVSDGERMAVVDLGFGVERLSWGIRGGYYLPEFADFYREHEEWKTDHLIGIVDAVRSMVLIAGEGVLPSNHEHGYRLRQLSKRYVSRTRGMDISIDELISISLSGWEKWGYQKQIETEKITKTIRTENERNYNSLLLAALRKEGAPVTIDINQSTPNFLRQIYFSLPQDTIRRIVEES